MKTYFGSRTLRGKAIVIVQDNEGKPHNLSLNPSLRIWRHSPDGFEWGYGGSGPAQLALAILWDHTHDRVMASIYHQDFKRDLIATLPKLQWRITGAEIDRWIMEQAKREAHHPVKGDLPS